MRKIPTIFLRDLDNKSRITRNPHPDCDWVFRGEGLPTRKYDGTCVLIQDGQCFKRREVRPGKKAPADFIEVQVDRETGKRIGWVPVRMGDPNDRYYFEALDRIGTPPDGTYELCGPKVQGNPEGFDEHVLVPHGRDILADCPRTFDELREWLADMDIEGIVFWHPDGRKGKIKKRDFGLPRVP